MAEENKKPTEIKQEAKPESKLEEKKPEQKKEKTIKKEFAIVNGRNIGMSAKEGADICSMIRNRNIDTAIKMVEEVISYKRAVMMNKRECAHRHGKGMMAGRYPINASKEFLKMLKQLKANALHHELEIEKCIITLCKTDVASRPYRRGGARFKRSNVLLKLGKKNEPKKMQNDKAMKGKLNPKKPEVS